MKYRKIKAGEIIRASDEYIPFRCTEEKKYFPVCACTIGQAILECNAKYYRRPEVAKQGN